jgi:hypothetical protein
MRDEGWNKNEGQEQKRGMRMKKSNGNEKGGKRGMGTKMRNGNKNEG